MDLRSTMPKKFIFVISGMLVFIMAVLMIIKRESPVLLNINEVMAANGSTLKDEDGEYVDWIELYYGGKNPISLEGYSLSDQKENIDLWKFPNIVMEPDSYLIIFASGKDRAEESGALHTNFKISPAGENIYLSDSEGQLISGISAKSTELDQSYGKISDNGAYSVLKAATPGRKNMGAIELETVKTSEIEFSFQAGYYEHAIDLELLTTEKNAKIYYTLDGSIPNENSFLYGKAVKISERTKEANRYTNKWYTPVDFGKEEAYCYNPEQQYKATVVKARLFFPENGSWSKDVWTNTYLIGAEYTMPIVSLSVSEELLFDEWTGIYMPGKAYDDFINSDEERLQDKRFWPGNYFDDKKVTGYLEFFEEGKNVLERPITLRICGAASRGNAQKSFAVYAWKDGERSTFSYPFFGEQCKNINGNTMNEFSSLRLRAFGNDSRRSMFRDALSQKIVDELNLGIQHYQPCILLINGEYFGVYEIRENRDDLFFEEHFGIKEGNLVKTELFRLTEDNANIYEKDFLELIDFVRKNDLYLEVNYEYVKSKLDVEQFVDYIIAEQYLNNIDWPKNNIIAFRSTKKNSDSEYEDGKWRFVLYDLDYAINYQAENNFKTLRESDSYVSILLNALLDNPDFCDLYCLRFEEMLNQYFEPSKVLNIQEEFENEFAPEIEESLKRWNVYDSNGTAIKEITVDYWYEKMEDIKTFLIERPEYAREYFYKEIEN